jgi:wyosine [tRNA(Phe)-imidazoG37] synthetase (radical SAM superfamily)
MMGPMPDVTPALREAFQRHERRWADNLFVYAVVSRRSHGVSVGINLNPGKECNFDCVYCQVDRLVPPRVRKVDLERLAIELDTVLRAAADGSLYDRPPFNALPADRREVRDIAFSGDGEPTTYPRFKEAVGAVAAARARFGLDATKIVLITDAAYLAKPAVREALEILDANNGEIWAKLDAGTDEYFQLIDRSNVSLAHVLENILDAARARPIVIQSLFMRVNGQAIPEAEVESYCDRLNQLRAAGGQIKAIQIYTIARKPAEPTVAPLPDAELDRLAEVVRTRVPVPVETFYGVAVETDARQSAPPPVSRV